MQLAMCFAAASNADGSAAAPTSASSPLEARPAAVTSDAPEGGAAPTANANNTAAESLGGVRATIHHMVSTVQLLQPGVASVWKRAFVVDMLVTVRVIIASCLRLAISMTHASSLGKCLGRSVTLQHNTLDIGDRACPTDKTSSHDSGVRILMFFQLDLLHSSAFTLEKLIVLMSMLCMLLQMSHQSVSARLLPAQRRLDFWF